MTLFTPLLSRFDAAALHYAVRIFLGSTIAWLVVGQYHEINALWAVIAVIVVTEPDIKTALLSFRGQVVGTCVGCLIGLCFLFGFGFRTWLLPFGAMLAAIVSINLIRLKVGWRIAPITVALVMSVGLTTHSTLDAENLAIGRVFGILVGSAIALMVTWVLSRFWMPPPIPQS